jgi:hypothetical protein
MNLFILLYIPKFIITIAIIVLLYYGFKFFSRHILPLLVDKGIKKMQQKMQDQQRQQQPSRPDGEVIIESNKNNKKDSTQKKGDYVDFEEVE